MPNFLSYPSNDVLSRTPNNFSKNGVNTLFFKNAGTFILAEFLFLLMYGLFYLLGKKFQIFSILRSKLEWNFLLCQISASYLSLSTYGFL